MRFNLLVAVNTNSSNHIYKDNLPRKRESRRSKILLVSS